MAAIVGALRAVLSLESAAFQKGLKQSQSALQGFSKRMNAIGGNATQLGQKLSVVSAAMAAAGAGLFAIAKNGADAMDKIGNSAKAAGLSATAYQEMAFAMGEAADITRDEFDAAMIRLNRTLGDAKDGSKSAIAAFDAIGISQTDIARGSVNTENALAALIDKLEATEDPALAAAMATDFFGKQGARIGGMLSGSVGQVKSFTDRARELGIVMSDDAVAASGKFNDKMAELGVQFEAVKMKIAEALLPVIVNDLIPAIQEKVIPALMAVVDKVGAVVKWFGDLPAPVQEAAAAIAAALGAGGPVLVAIGVMSKALSMLIAGAGPVGLFIAAAAAAYAAWQIWGDDIKALVGAVYDWLSEKFSALAKFMTEYWDEILLAITPPGMLVLAWRTFGDDITAAVRQAVDWIVQKFTEMLDFVRGIPAQMMQIGRDIIDGLQRGIQEKMDAMIAWFQAKIDGMTGGVKSLLGIQSPSRVYNEIGGYITEGLAAGIEGNLPMVDTAMGGLADAVDGNGLAGVADDAKESFKGLFSSILSGSQSAGEALSDMLSGFADKLLSSGLDMLWGAIFPNANGNAFSNGRVTAFANGGVVTGPTTFGMKGGTGLMGEAGPEAIMPLTRVGGKLGVMASGGKTAPQVHYNIDARGASKGVDELIADALNRATPRIVSQSVLAVNDRRNRGWG